MPSPPSRPAPGIPGDESSLLGQDSNAKTYNSQSVLVAIMVASLILCCCLCCLFIVMRMRQRDAEAKPIMVTVDPRSDHRNFGAAGGSGPCAGDFGPRKGAGPARESVSRPAKPEPRMSTLKSAGKAVLVGQSLSPNFRDAKPPPRASIATGGSSGSLKPPPRPSTAGGGASSAAVNAAFARAGGGQPPKRPSGQPLGSSGSGGLQGGKARVSGQSASQPASQRPSLKKAGAAVTSANTLRRGLAVEPSINEDASMKMRDSEGAGAAATSEVDLFKRTLQHAQSGNRLLKPAQSLTGAPWSGSSGSSGSARNLLQARAAATRQSAAAPSRGAGGAAGSSSAAASGDAMRRAFAAADKRPSSQNVHGGSRAPPGGGGNSASRV